MALSDWDSYITNTPGLSFSINVLTPLVSLGSGRIGGVSLSGGTSTALINPTVASGRTTGVTRGKFRSLFRYNTFTVNGRIGLSFLQTNKNLTSGSSNFYKTEIRQGDGLVRLVKVTNSIVLDDGSTLQSASFATSNNTVFSLEVEWIVDIAELGGTAMFVRTGAATDYSDLATVIRYLDVSSPFTTSVAESLFVVETTSGLGIFNVDFDQTTLFVP